MTIKLPEPVQNHSDVRMYGYEAIIPIAASTNLYTESQLKQAMCDVLEDAAKKFDLLTGREMFGPEIADKLRELKEQLK